MGYSLEGINLAEDFENSERLSCREASEDYRKMNLNQKITMDIFKTFVYSLEKMAIVRKGFYCILCDARTQRKLNDFWVSTNLFYRDRIYFSKDFCRKLVENTIRSSYFTVYYLKRFAEDLSTLINCRTDNTTELTFDIPYWTVQQVKNCFYFKDKYFFFFCEKYCQKFHLVKPDNIFDGNLRQLQKFVEHIMKYKGEVFDYENHNVLMGNARVTFEDDFLREKYKEVYDDELFFKASMDRVKLDEFKTDVVFYGGMDPWESCEDSLYNLVLKNVQILDALLALLILIMF